MNTNNGAPSKPTAPKQARAHRTIAAIVNACYTILLDEGVEALTTNRIAEVACVNISTLYRWFSNKEDIMHEVFSIAADQEIAILEDLYHSEAVEGDVSLEKAIEYVIDPLIVRQQRFLSLHALFYRENQNDFDISKRSFLSEDITWMQQYTDWLKEILTRHKPGCSQATIDMRAFIVPRALQAICMEAARDKPSYLDESAFRSELLDLALKYLE